MGIISGIDDSIQLRYHFLQDLSSRIGEHFNRGSVADLVAIAHQLRTIARERYSVQREQEEFCRRQQDDALDVSRQGRHKRGKQALTELCKHLRDGFLPGLEGGISTVNEVAVIGSQPAADRSSISIPFGEQTAQVCLCEVSLLNYLDLLIVLTHDKAYAALFGNAEGNQGRLLI